MILTSSVEVFRQRKHATGLLFNNHLWSILFQEFTPVSCYVDILEDMLLFLEEVKNILMEQNVKVILI
jgi:hypothetical protein